MDTSRMRLFLAVLLVVSGALFAIGAGIERSQTHESAPTTETSPASAEGGGGETSGASPAPATEPAHVEATGSSETLLGINPEATALVIVAILASLALALGVRFWGHRPVLFATLVFGAVFAALDVKELVHQAHASRTGLVILALALALLHAGVSVVAGAALRAREEVPAGA